MNLAAATIGHMVGDYLLQNDWMALGKKHSSFVCFIHSLIWALCVVVIGGCETFWLMPLTVLHFIQDRWNLIPQYMALVGQTKFSQAPMSPWSIIVVDNTWHLVTIYAVWLLGK